MENSVSGSAPVGPQLSPKGRRFAGGVVDLIIVPIILGIIVGILTVSAPELLRSFILVLVNAGWLLFRDLVFAPGRAMVGVKLISLVGGKVTFKQALIRNILIMLPFVLVVGYLVEIIALLVKGERVADGWAKTRVVIA